MTYSKRQSAALEKAKTRLLALQSIHPNLDLGNGLTLQAYAALIEASSTQLQRYNLALIEADRTRIEFSESEAAISALSSRILSAVAALYGKESKEYEMAGGKPPSSYKRSKKTTSTVSLAGSQSESLSTPTATNGTALNGATSNGAGTVTQLN